MNYEKIQKSSLRFSVNFTRYIFKPNRDNKIRILLNQLLRAGTSVGANLEEADSAASRKDFIHKISISKKEARETKYWLELISQSGLIINQKDKQDLDALLKEIDEIERIIGAIHYKTKYGCAKPCLPAGEHTTIGHCGIE